MIDWTESLVDDIARRKCILFLGAGVSMNSIGNNGSRPPGWRAFLENCMSGLQKTQQIKKLIGNEDYLTACELIKSKLAKGKFDTLLRKSFLEPQYKHASLHQHLFKLDCRIVLTPNFDKIYETFVTTETQGTVVVKNYYDQDIVTAIKGDGRVIIKTHGTVDNTQSLIFSRGDYARARSQNRDFYELLNALSLTNTFLFVGCGVNDPDIRLLLEDSFFKHNATKPHFMISSDKGVHKEMIPVIEDTLNLNILQYREQKGSHEELINSFSELVGLVDIKRNILKETMNW
ncbi:SIR2 family protein [Serratia marcescens]|uniref:SIR2 family protein n=1 Tax=Serratia TaxID=613 RepID=UPI0018D6DDAA|nr:SIR2 family protein [Serratia marcescens]MBH2572083.1 SIR2 family protein [Serratia marcescens]MBH2610649.1 SIR2 family protein [Serratia marcescens]MBH2928994.1 SIR2 family protein [Serratia marcescens]MBH2940335.1 SIR2 family protein [Serratia marcescens]MBN5329328.1 SIR2 family protein [Serratia marcescens]